MHLKSLQEAKLTVYIVLYVDYKDRSTPVCVSLKAS